MKYHKDYDANLQKRLELTAKCADLDFREQVKTLFFNDILFAFNMFFYTLDVRKRPYHNQPFCTWEFQDEFILNIKEHIDIGRDIVVEKSRDMGVSWAVIMVFFWFWLNPKGGADFLLGSRIEDYVDKKGDMRTLMAKARYALYKLPQWLRPKGFIEKKHDNYMRLYNPESGSAITGESNNANFSTGGRYAGILLDEFAKWDITDKPAWTAAGDATPSRIAVSTPFGAAGQYYDLVTDGKTDKVTLHWSRHPEKGKDQYCELPKRDAMSDLHLIRSPWFNEQQRRRTDTEIAQELQIDYIGAGRPVFDGRAARSLLWYHKNCKNKPVYYDLMQGKPIPSLVHGRQEGILIQYEKFKAGQEYIISADIAEGRVEGDSSAAVVLNRATLNVDAVYHAHTNEVEMAHTLFEMGRAYSSDVQSIDAPCIAIETNGPGLATFDRIQMMAYVNLFMMPRFDVTKQATSYKKGWRTDLHSKPAMIASVREYLEKKHGLLNYHPIVRELQTYVLNKQGKAEAKHGCHDDLVIALGISLQIHSILPQKNFNKVLTNQVEYGSNFSLENYKNVDEPTDLQEICLLQAKKKRSRVRETELFF